MIWRLTPLGLASFLAGRLTAVMPPLTEPSIENDGDVRRLAKRRAQVVVDVPVLA